jgi:2C-methyl-D-erythritol 2,4-cyclodiphosphate synthase
MAAYDTILNYLNCSSSVQEEIARTDAIITALMDAQLNAAINSGDIDEYSLDDGQTKIRTVIRDPEKIMKAIEALERRKNHIINQNCLGRVIKLRDKDSFNLYKGYGY